MIAQNTEFELGGLAVRLSQAGVNIRKQDHDPVTRADGVLVVNYPIPDLFPNGFVVLQDNENEEAGGGKDNANYKIIDWLKLGH